MIKIRPSTKIVLTFVVTFVLTYVAIIIVISSIKTREHFLHKEAAHVIQDDISEQFNLVLDKSRIIGQLASVTIYNQIKANSSYIELVRKVLEGEDYILGLNQLNTEGKIITIYPPQENEQALGKISQNTKEIHNSFARGEDYWFSPPFQLYQGTTGFVFYIPVTENGKLLGWMAPVIGSQLFFEHFRNMDFFKDYDLVIKDGLTGHAYFESAMPKNKAEIQQTTVKMWGRELTFQSWSKKPISQFDMSYIVKFLICFFSSIISALIMKTYLQKNKAYSRLDNISELLKLTSTEALSKLVDLQEEYLANKDTSHIDVEKNIQSVSNLIEQVELLQNFANTTRGEAEDFELLPIFTEHVQSMREIIKRKNIDLNLDSDSFKEISIFGNKWLISNAVIKNILSYCALITQPNGTINITHRLHPNECITVIHIDKIYDQNLHDVFNIDRRLMVVKNAAAHINSDLKIYSDGSGGMTLKLSKMIVSKTL